ncbi:hypothetical protein [Jiella sp. M17.18]|uniref:hypothetical protein n=1 Tax=Jiella sp. M17.18 TaxID=3234247 RepID=UPI0034DF58AE
MHSRDLLFRVEPAGERWAVSFCHEPHGLFPRRVEAMRFAVDDATRVGRLGHTVRVTVSRPSGAPSLGERVLRPHQ